MTGGPQAEWHRDLALIAASGTVAGLDDAELLGRFNARRGDAAEAAFEAIVARHGPMVLAVCRRSLRDAPDVDDAFQATFLVLARRAPSLRVGDSLAPWLYTVARRVSAKARSRRRPTTARLDSLDLPAPEADPSIADLQLIIDEELTRLPEKYRAPVVLCHLEGLTHEQAARQLHWPVGTLSGRLSRARTLLRARLSRRGLGASATAAFAALAPRGVSAIPPSLLRSTARVALLWSTSRVAPSAILQLSRGVLLAMTLTHRAVLGSLAFSVVTLSAAGAYYATAGSTPEPSTPQPPPAAAPEVAPQQEKRHIDFDIKLPDPIWKSVLTHEQYVASLAPDNRSIRAISLRGLGPRGNQWETYTPPEGIKATPVGDGPATLALALQGAGIREIAVFDIVEAGNAIRTPAGTKEAGSGLWHTKTLRTPVNGWISPLVTPEAVTYGFRNDFYIYNPSMDVWNELHLTGTGITGSRLNKTSIHVLSGDRLHVYSLLTNQWAPEVTIKPADAEAK